MSEYEIKDSGERQEFDGGMVRDTEEGKIDYTNLFEHFEPMGTRYAQHMTKGRNKYPDPEPGTPNWKLTDITPEAVERFKRSAARHFKQWLRGDTDEDHAAAVLFNINGAEFVEEGLAEADRNYDRLAEQMLEEESFDSPHPVLSPALARAEQAHDLKARNLLDMFDFVRDIGYAVNITPDGVFAIDAHRDPIYRIDGRGVEPAEFYTRFAEAVNASSTTSEN